MVLYYVDDEHNNVDIVWDAELNDSVDKSAIEQLKSNMQTYTFDKLFHDYEDLRKAIPAFQLFVYDIISNLSKGKKEFEELEKKYFDLQSQYERKNVFVDYFLNLLWSKSIKKRKDLNRSWAIFINSITNLNYSKKEISEIQKLLDSIVSETEIDPLSNLSNCLEIKTIKSQTVFIREGYTKKMFFVSDEQLTSLLLSLSYVINRHGYSIGTCRYCNAHYLGRPEMECCQNELCIRKLLTKQYDSEGADIYYAEWNKFCGYSRKLKSDLKKECLNNQTVLNEFNALQKEIKTNVKDKLIEYRIERKILSDPAVEYFLSSSRIDLRKAYKKSLNK